MYYSVTRGIISFYVENISDYRFFRFFVEYRFDESVFYESAQSLLDLLYL